MLTISSLDQVVNSSGFSGFEIVKVVFKRFLFLQTGRQAETQTDTMVDTQIDRKTN